ncbi:ENR1 protein, partial [Caloenas nicobarica]|nr:ENR1 protein [Caloenas nicobarica]
RLSEWDLPTPGKNLFVDLMQEIIKELNVTGCWICGGSQMTEQWPWRGEGVSLEQLLKWNQTHKSLIEIRPEGWILSHEVIGLICITRIG